MAKKIGGRIEERQVIWRNHGFHGDPNLMALVDLIVRTSNIRTFIETGTESGSTLGYMARTYPDLECVSCEADRRIYQTAKQNLSRHPNATIKNKKAVPFLDRFSYHYSGLGRPVLFWLDAHSHGYGCTLPEELGIILSRIQSGYIFIDDFLVPDNPEFKYDEYVFEGEEPIVLDQEYIRPAIEGSGRTSEIYIQYPNYEPQYNGRGWILLTFGHTPVMSKEEE